MISTYLKSYNSLDNIQPLRDKIFENVNETSSYWYLNQHHYELYVWNDCIFSSDELDSIIKIGTTLNMERAQTGGAGENCLDHRRSFVSWIPTNSHTSWIYNKLSQSVVQINQQFFKFDLTQIERLQFTHYKSEEEGCYKKHIDPLTWNVPHNRKLSVVIQLSDPSEYEGGDLILHHGHEGIKIQKKKGMGVFFPSYTLHECTPVTKGERYALVAWVHGPPFR